VFCRMPSTHSAAVACYATYIPLASAYLGDSESSLTAAPLFRTMVPLVVVPSAVIVASSRVWLGHHTWPQVAAGSLFGVSFSLVWFTIWANGVGERAKMLEDTVRVYLSSALQN
jgi:dolichyldiphosphatase